MDLDTSRTKMGTLFSSAQLYKVKLIRSVCECVQEGVRTASIPFAQGCAHGGSLDHVKSIPRMRTREHAYRWACVQLRTFYPRLCP